MVVNTQISTTYEKVLATYSQKVKRPTSYHRKVDQRSKPASKHYECVRHCCLQQDGVHWGSSRFVQLAEHCGEVSFSSRSPDKPCSRERRTFFRFGSAVNLGSDEKYQPLRAPKQDTATKTANTTPPTGPKSARPKSSATALLLPTVTLSSTTRYATFARMNNVFCIYQSQPFTQIKFDQRTTYADDSHAQVDCSGYVLVRVTHLPANVICLIPSIKCP